MTEHRIIQDCLKGKRNAQRRLYERYAGKLMALCLRYARTREEAEDIMQDGFIKIFRDLKSYKPIAPLYAWMRMVMLRTALEHIRKHRLKSDKTRSISEQPGLVGINPEADSRLRERELLALIQKLPEKLRLVFNLYAIEGYTHQEISDMLGVTVSNSKVRLNRARNQLQQELRDLHEKETRWKDRI